MRDGARGPDLSLLRDPLLYGAALMALTICSPFFRYLPWFGDEGVFLHAATRILDGQVLYRDFFEILPPASFLIVAAWMKLAGAGFASVRALAIAVLVAIAVLLYAAARLSSARRPMAALAALIWLVYLRGEWVVISHHWFTTAASMASGVALLLALERVPPRGAVFASGLFAGAAAMLTPTRGALLCVAVLGMHLTLPGARVRLAKAMAGIVLFPAATLLYLVRQDVLAAALDQVLRFPARHYSAVQGVSFGHFAILDETVSVALLPVTFVLAATTLILGRGPTWREPRFRASLALAIVGLLGTYPRPDIAHISFTAPLVWPLLALAATDQLGRLKRPARTAVSALLIIVCLGPRVGELGSSVRLLVAADEVYAVPTMRGLTVRRRDPLTGAFAALVAAIRRVPGDGFFYPYDPMLPYLTGRRHVAPIDVIVPGYTTPQQFRATCEHVVSEAQWVVIDKMWSNPSFLRAVLPALSDPEPPEKRRFETAIALAFDEVVHASGFFEIRRRAATASVSLCDAPD